MNTKSMITHNSLVIARLSTLPLLVALLASFAVQLREPKDDVVRLDSIVVPIPEMFNRGNLYVFMDSMAVRESNNTPTIVNRYGYMGKYQFGPRTLWALGRQFRVAKDEFLGNVALQDSAMMEYLKDNREIIGDLVIQYNGRWYNGIYITESGLLAGAHLVGPHGLRAYFDPSYRIRRNGRVIRPRTRDGNGIKVEEYISQFSGFNLAALTQ